MVGQPKIDDLDVLNPLALADVGRSALEVLSFLLVLEHDHDVFGFEIAVHDFEFMQVHDALHDVADDECAFELI